MTSGELVVPNGRPFTRVETIELGDDLRGRQMVIVGQRGSDRWLSEHPAVGPGWEQRCRDGDVFVGCIDDVVIGYLVAELGADAIVRIDQVWVTPQARELGFGDELLATAIADGRRRGAVAVEGQALPGDRHTKNLYERAGIVARLITTFRWL
jgi:ribosomal protein S18 acetylase RimI-like enzyme